MSDNNLEYLRVLNDAMAAGLHRDPRAAIYLHALAARPHDQRLLRSIQYQTAMANLVGPLRRTLFVVPHAMCGDFRLGRQPGGPAVIDFEDLAGNLMILGGTGAGKTVSYFYWTSQILLRPDVGMWIFDFAKREFRHLLPVATLARRELYLLRWRWFPFNPLEVPRGVHPTEHANTAADNFTCTLGVPPVARNLLRVGLIRLYKRNGVYEGSKRWPTLRELADEIRIMKGNEAAKQAILDRLDTLLAVAGEMLDHRRGLPLEALEGLAVVFELDGLGLIYQCFLAACMLSAAFARRVATRDIRKILVVTFDEGQQLYSQRAQASAEGPSYISLMTSQVRAMRIILIIGTQSMNDLSRSLLSNTATKICARCGDCEDYAGMAHSMGLNSEQRAWLPLNLAPGLFVAKLNYGDNQHPFLLRVPFVALPQIVSDSEVEDSGLRLRRALNWVEEPAPTPPAPPFALPAPAAQAPPPDALTVQEQRFYDAVLENPYRPSHQLAAVLGISKRLAISLRRGLCERKYLEEWAIDAAHGGAKMIVLVPLRAQGREAAPPAVAGRQGGRRHRFAVAWIHTALSREGWNVRTEAACRVGDEMTFVDIAAMRGDEELLVEFELRPDYAVANVRKDLLIGSQPVRVVTALREVERAIRKNLQEALSPAEIGRVSFAALSSFVRAG